MSSKKAVVHIEVSANQAALSPAQKKFNTLIKSINKQRTLLEAWQTTILQCQQQASEKLVPLQQQLGEHQAKFVLLLDQQFTQHKFTKIQQDKLSHIILQLTDVLINEHQREDLKPLFDKYSEDSFDDLDQAGNEYAVEMIKITLEQQFGLQVEDSDIDVNDIDATLERLQEKLNRHHESQQIPPQKSKPTKPSAKQQAKAVREAEEAEQVSKSIQTVYRQLTSALHPDREPDPVERERKTELMQQVTVAYGKKDLLKLLELQLAVEQIDHAKLGNLAEDRLKHYNKVLNNQLSELKAEVQAQEMRGRSMIKVPPFVPIVPQHLSICLKQDLKNTHETIALFKRDLRQFQDVKQLKVWLNSYRLPSPDLDFSF